MHPFFILHFMVYLVLYESSKQMIRERGFYETKAKNETKNNQTIF